MRELSVPIARSAARAVGVVLTSAALAVALLANGACTNDGPQCNCPEFGPGMALIDVACDAPATITASDGCNASVSGQYVTVNQGDAGDGCQAAVTIGGATTIIDFTFTHEWVACGSDPHGCGQGFATSPARLTLPCGDAGVGTIAPDAAIDGAAE